VRDQLLDIPIEIAHGRIHELVDQSANDVDDNAGTSDHFRSIVELQAAALQRTSQECAPAAFLKWHPTAFYIRDLGDVLIQNTNVAAGIDESEGEWQADMAATANDHDVKRRLAAQSHIRSAAESNGGLEFDIMSSDDDRLTQGRAQPLPSVDQEPVDSR